MHVEVDCYSEYKADERPGRFRLDGHEYLVEELLDQLYGQNNVFFKVRADYGDLYILSRALSTEFRMQHRLWERHHTTNLGSFPLCESPPIPKEKWTP